MNTRIKSQSIGKTFTFARASNKQTNGSSRKFITATSLSIAFLLGGLASTKTVTANEAILIGGGYKLAGSQGQIEQNVQWVREILSSKDFNLRVFYSDGDNPNPDVFSLIPETEETKKLEPLTRVFGTTDLNNTVYTNHQIPDVSGSTEKFSLSESLKNILSDITTDTLMVFNGHGAQATKDRSSTSLKLWGDTRLTAAELHPIVDQLDPNVAFRYVFTQCYSGGFHQLIYDDAIKRESSSTANRCGFTAESAYRMSEGCSSSLKLDDYRDYTTFFFAALNGKDRLNNDLKSNPDTDGNGKVSYREAHMYTIKNAVSTDLSRSSSEQFLEDWQPWYLRWLPANTSELSTNEYTELLNDLSKTNTVETSDVGVVEADAVDDEQELSAETSMTALRNNLSNSENKFNSLKQEHYSERSSAEKSRRNIQADLLGKWPALGTPYTTAFNTLVGNDLQEILDWIVVHDAYESMLTQQDSMNNRLDALLAAERQVAQSLKALRMRKLSRLKTELYQYGSDQDQIFYEKLLQCENGYPE